jgi:hypothetical protein
LRLPRTGGDRRLLCRRRERVIIQRAFPGARLSLGQRRIDCFPYLLRLPFPVLVPAPDHTITLLAELSRPGSLPPRLLGMWTALKFDTQPWFETTAIRIVRTDAMLAAKLQAGETLAWKLRPQLARRLGCCPRQPPHPRPRHFVNRIHNNRAVRALNKDPLPPRTGCAAASP